MDRNQKVRIILALAIQGVGFMIADTLTDGFGSGRLVGFTVAVAVTYAVLAKFEVTL